jgi:hypothetical protein
MSRAAAWGTATPSLMTQICNGFADTGESFYTPM